MLKCTRLGKMVGGAASLCLALAIAPHASASTHSEIKHRIRYISPGQVAIAETALPFPKQTTTLLVLTPPKNTMLSAPADTDWAYRAGKTLAKEPKKVSVSAMKPAEKHSEYLHVGQSNLAKTALPRPGKTIKVRVWKAALKPVKPVITPMPAMAIATERPDIASTPEAGNAKLVSVENLQIPIDVQGSVGSTPNETIAIEQPSRRQQARTNALTKPASTTGSTGFSLNKKLGLTPKSRIHINGFISVGASKTNAKNGVDYNIPSRGLVDDNISFASNSLIGLQITGNISKKISAVGQLVASGDSTNGHDPYSVNVEWAFLRYKASRNVEIRGGRFRSPLFLYSQTAQVGYTYPWMFLPNEVYRIVPFQNINGMDSVYTIPLGSTGWSIKVNPFYGMNESKFDLYTRGSTPAGPIPAGTTARFRENHIAGAAISFSNPYLTLRGAYAHTRLNAYISRFIPAGGATVTLFSNEPTHFYTFGGKFHYHNFLVVGEYAHRSTPPVIASLSGIYGLIGYHIFKFLPTFTYGNIWTTNTSSLFRQPVSELPQQQASYTLALAYYMNRNLVAKGSFSYITPLNGTNGLFTVNPGKNVMLYGLEVDAIF